MNPAGSTEKRIFCKSCHCPTSSNNYVAITTLLFARVSSAYVCLMKIFKNYSTIICVCLLQKFIFDIPGVLGDGSNWALAPSPPPSPSRSLQGNPQSDRVRPEPACLSPGLGARSPRLSGRLLLPGVSPPHFWPRPWHHPQAKNLGAGGAASWEKASAGLRGFRQECGLFSRLRRHFRCLTGFRPVSSLSHRKPSQNGRGQASEASGGWEGHL